MTAKRETLSTRDAERARRIVGWLFLLRALRRAADSVPSGQLIEKLKLADLDVIEDDAHALMVMFRQRFVLMDAEHARSANLAPRSRTVTDAQILAAVAKYPTRTQQARRLGIGVRQLQRRLARLRRDK